MKSDLRHYWADMPFCCARIIKHIIMYISGADVTPNNDATVDGVASGNSMNRAR